MDASVLSYAGGVPGNVPNGCNGFIPVMPLIALRPQLCAVPFTSAAFSQTGVAGVPCPAQGPAVLGMGLGVGMGMDAGCVGMGMGMGMDPGWLCSSFMQAQEVSQRAAALSQAVQQQRQQEQLKPPEVPVVGSVRRLSREYQGCRRVQEALEAASSEAERSALASELQGHIWHATLCPNANHVVQKLVITMKAESVQFIINELTRKGPEATCKVARNQYGCRVLQRLLEQCFPQQLRGLVGDLLTERGRLCAHIYGNYVMRHLLEYGPPEERHQLALYVEAHVQNLGADERACAVLCKALQHAALDDRKAIALAILEEPGLMVHMASTRHGHVATECVLRLLHGARLGEARQLLLQAEPPLGASRFGRSVLALLQAPQAAKAANGAAEAADGPPAVCRVSTEASSEADVGTEVTRSCSEGDR